MIDGLVTDVRNNPVAAARVQLVPDLSRPLLPRDLVPVAEVKTDAEGRFRIDAPSEGQERWAVLVSAPGLERVKIPGTDDLDNGNLRIRLEAGRDISGQVTDANGKPVPDAMVGPLTVAEDSERRGAAYVAPQWTQTDGNGNFRFSHLVAEEQYSLLIQVPGHEAARLPVSAATGPVNVALKAGGSEVGGLLAARDLAPEQLSGTLVMLSGSGYNMLALAGPEGEFSFSGIAPGEYSASAFPPSPRTAAPVSLIMPQDSGTSIAIQLSGAFYAEGTVVDIETSGPGAGVPLLLQGVQAVSGADGSFRLGPLFQPGILQFEVPQKGPRGWRLAGSPGESARPLPEADGVEDRRGLVLEVEPRRSIEIEVLNFSATTEALTLHLLRAGSGERQYPLTSSTVTVPLEGAGRYRAYAEGGNLASDLRSFDVTSGSLLPQILPDSEAGNDKPLALYLQPESILEGRATRAEANETNGIPMAGCSVAVIILDEQTTNGEPLTLAETLTDSSGTFTIRALPATACACRAATAGNTQALTQQLTLRPGMNNCPEFRFKAGRRLAGEVVDPEGKPVSGATVRHYVRTPSGDTLAGDISTDAQGEFVAEDLQGDMVDLLQISHPDFNPLEEKNLALPAEEHRFTLQLLQGLRFSVEAPEDSVWLVRLMLAGPWGQAPNADQLIAQTVAQETVSGGKEGKFQPTVEGLYCLVARGPARGVAVSQAIQWQDGRSNLPDEVMLLKPDSRGTIQGTLSGAPEGDIRIVATNTWLPENVGPDEAKGIAHQGRVSLSGVLPGNYLVMAEGDGYAATATNAQVGPGQTANVELKAAALKDVSGKVVLAGEPVEGALVRILSETAIESHPQQAYTDSDGIFTFNGVTPDTYFVQTELPQVNPGAEPVRAQRSIKITYEENNLMLELELSPPSPVSFYLQGGNPEAPVSLMNLETREVIKARWNGNAYEAAARPGSYEITRGDAPAGQATVTPDGKVSVRE